MAVTRHATGKSTPRQFLTVSTEPSTKKRTTGGRKKATANKTATGRVGKAPTTHHQRKPTLADKVKGAAKKVEGVIERKPGKKAAGTSEMRGHDGKKSTTKKTTTKKAATGTTTKKATAGRGRPKKTTEVDVKV